MIRARTALWHDDEPAALDLTPLLDVIFMLLVFLLLTANSVQHALQLDLPEKGADQARPLKEAQRITITLFDQTDKWQVNDETFASWKAVESTILTQRKASQETEIIIQGDRLAPMEKLLQVLAFLKREGLSAARILMEQEPGITKNSATEFTE